MVTGGTSGMGLETAKALAHRGAKVVIVGRNCPKCEDVVCQIKDQTNNPNINYMLADLSSQDQIRKLASDFKKKYKALHVLINNAGGFFLKKELSRDGIEMTFALNYLSHFLLTNLLLDLLKKSAPARIINVSSWEHFRAEFDADNLQSEKGYFCWNAYAKSKLGNILFTYELARRLEDSGVTVNTLHPGWVATNIGKNNGVLAKLLLPLIQRKAVPAAEGAKTCIHLAVSDHVSGISGKYFAKEKEGKSSQHSYNLDHAKKLWQMSEELCGISNRN